MATEDHLDKETSVSLALKDAGVEFKSKSRTLSIIDRMAANFFERRSFKGERDVQINRQKLEIELSLIKRASETLLKRAEIDEQFAEDILAGTFAKDARRQLNKDGVVEAALEQLRLEPPSSDVNSSGPDELSPEFSDRFERYAEDASSEQLRERWGKVLASEIKKPGTFSGKVLRVIDELDSQTASLFERLMQYRIREALLKPIMPELNFADTLALVSAGLIVEPGLSGHVTEWTEMRDNQGSELWVYGFGKFALGLKKDSPITYGTDAPIEENNGKPANPVFLLTDVGRALSTIISQDESKAGFQFLKKLKGYQPTEGVRFYVHDGGNNWKLLPTPE